LFIKEFNQSGSVVNHPTNNALMNGRRKPNTGGATIIFR